MVCIMNGTNDRPDYLAFKTTDRCKWMQRRGFWKAVWRQKTDHPKDANVEAENRPNGSLGSSTRVFSDLTFRNYDEDNTTLASNRSMTAHPC